jgi:hypothetical protein
MLTISLEKLAFIITKAREFDVEVPPVDEDSGSNPSDDADRDVLESISDNPTYQELVDALNSLNDPERIELLALTWVGRGDYSREEWLEALEEASRIHDEKETDYLIGTPLLADYLKEGLSQLGYSVEDFEGRATVIRERRILWDYCADNLRCYSASSTTAIAEGPHYSKPGRGAGYSGKNGYRACAAAVPAKDGHGSFWEEGGRWLITS